MAKQWIKLSAGVHKDRKMWKLSKDAQLVFFYLLSLAGAEDEDGALPPMEDIALELWFLKLSEKSLNSVFSELKKYEIIESNGSEIKLKNFEKWQVTEKTKSEIDREYYLKNKKRKTEIQPNLSENSAELSEIQSENSAELSENSAKIPTLEIDKEIDIDKDKELINNTLANASDARGKNPQSEKFPFGSQNNVMLTQQEYAKLCEQLPDADSKIEAMSLYFASHGNAKKYKSHYATALNWARMAAERDSGKEKKAKDKSFADIAAEYEKRQPEPDPVWDIVDL